MRWRLPVFAWPKVRAFVLPSLYVARWRPITRRYQAVSPVSFGGRCSIAESMQACYLTCATTAHKRMESPQ